MARRSATSQAVPALLLALTALLFATGGAAIKATTFTAWQTAAFRSGIAASALWLLLPEARRDWHRSTWLAAASYAATLILFVHATKRTTSANAVFLQASAPVYLLLIGPLVLKEKLRRADLWMALLIGTGMALFFVGHAAPQATAPDPATGNSLAALSGVTWAATLAGLRLTARRPGGSALPMVVAGNMLVFFVAMPQAFPVKTFECQDLAVVAYLGCIQIALAYWLLTIGIRRVPAFESSLILLLEPVLNPVWSWLIHHERMDGWALTGAGFVLAGVAYQAWSARPEMPVID